MMGWFYIPASVGLNLASALRPPVASRYEYRATTNRINQLDGLWCSHGSRIVA